MHILKTELTGNGNFHSYAANRNIYVYICYPFKRKTEAQAIFLNLFTVCLLCKRNFVFYPFVDEETD